MHWMALQPLLCHVVMLTHLLLLLRDWQQQLQSVQLRHEGMSLLLLGMCSRADMWCVHLQVGPVKAQHEEGPHSFITATAAPQELAASCSVRLYVANPSQQDVHDVAVCCSSHAPVAWHDEAVGIGAVAAGVKTPVSLVLDFSTWKRALPCSTQVH